MNAMQRVRGMLRRLLVVTPCLALTSLPAASDDQEPLPKYSDEGYLAGWFVIGPFPQQDSGSKEPIDVSLGDEVDGLRYGGRDYSWEFAKRHAEPYRIDLAAQFGSSDPGVAYAATEVYVNRDVHCELRIRTDERVTIWIDGQRCALAKRSILRKNTDVFRHRLRFGFNRIVVRVPQKKGPWTFRAQLLNEDGKPIAKKIFWLKEDPRFSRDNPGFSQDSIGSGPHVLKIQRRKSEP